MIQFERNIFSKEETVHVGGIHGSPGGGNHPEKTFLQVLRE